MTPAGWIGWITAVALLAAALAATGLMGPAPG
jgi:2-methylcitrate dehydratase PrpD